MVIDSFSYKKKKQTEETDGERTMVAPVLSIDTQHDDMIVRVLILETIVFKHDCLCSMMPNWITTAKNSPRVRRIGRSKFTTCRAMSKRKNRF